MTTLSMESVLSVMSAAMTGYFWLVKARREKARLQFFQLHGFRASLRRGDEEKKTRRLCLSQVDAGGVLVANDSTRQNSIIRFDCYLRHRGQQIKGTWGYVDNDKPPWNIPPESTISLSLACFFEVPEDYEIRDNLAFRVEFVTVGNHRFKHLFSLQSPAW